MSPGLWVNAERRCAKAAAVAALAVAVSAAPAEATHIKTCRAGKILVGGKCKPATKIK